MRRIGLIVSSLLAAGSLFVAARAFACESKPDATVAKKLDIKSFNSKKGHNIFTPQQATKQGQLDDRLIRPHRAYDASAGVVG
ncbi:MAG: hypothetical protein JST54_35350 [Deltaproteobacteria bacterium]|nr:hypothetical protein [Deltaproteobacteria bacterium]